MPALKRADTVYVAGHRGLVGSAVVRALAGRGYRNVVVRAREDLDLQDQAATLAFLSEQRPDAVIVAAALVGGIHANSSRPADFIGTNLAIQQSIVWGSHLAAVPTLLFLGSSCVYPRETAQPIPESALLSGYPEPTNKPYAVAKIAGVALCEAIRTQYGRDYFSVMPPNVYGPGDNFHPEDSHVVAALIRKFHEALPDRPVTCWGTGTPRREFLHVDDVADACLFLLESGRAPSVVNVGTGTSVSIRSLAEAVQRVVGHRGPVYWDTSRPDGFPEKTNDVSLLRSLGWSPRIGLEQGLEDAYSWFKRKVVPNIPGCETRYAVSPR